MAILKYTVNLRIAIYYQTVLEWHQIPNPIQSGFFMETDKSLTISTIFLFNSYGYHTLAPRIGIANKAVRSLSELIQMQRTASSTAHLNPERLSNVNCSRCSRQIGFKHIRAIVVM